MDAAALIAAIDAYTDAKVRATVVKMRLVQVNAFREQTVYKLEAARRADLLSALETLQGPRNEEAPHPAP